MLVRGSSVGSRRLTGRGSVGFALAPLEEVENMRLEVVSHSPLRRRVCAVTRGHRCGSRTVAFFFFVKALVLGSVRGRGIACGDVWKASPCKEECESDSLVASFALCVSVRVFFFFLLLPWR